MTVRTSWTGRGGATTTPIGFGATPGSSAAGSASCSTDEARAQIDRRAPPTNGALARDLRRETPDLEIAAPLHADRVVGRGAVLGVAAADHEVREQRDPRRLEHPYGAELLRRVRGAGQAVRPVVFADLARAGDEVAGPVVEVGALWRVAEDDLGRGPHGIAVRIRDRQPRLEHELLVLVEPIEAKREDDGRLALGNRDLGGSGRRVGPERSPRLRPAAVPA